MLRFAVSRLLQMLLSMWVALTLLFVAVTQLPGDPVRALFGFKPPPPEIYSRIREQFHLGESVPSQYLAYVGSLLRGDLGNSYPLDPYGNATVGASVSDTLAAVVPVSAVLLAASLLVQALVGVVAGSLAARKRTRLSRSLYALALLLVSAPVLLAAFTLRTVFGTGLGWLPVRGLAAGPQAYVLPVLALSALSTGYVMLLTRSEVRETLAAPYIAAARGRGLSPAVVLSRHALRPSLIPVAAFLAANAGQLFVGLIVVEGIFGIPGLGGAIFDSINNRDRSLLIGLVTVVMAVVIMANAAADLLIAALDPRVRQAQRV